MKMRFSLVLSLLSAAFLMFPVSAASSSRFPYEFTYNGKSYKGFEGVIDGTLKVSVVSDAHPEYGQSEYTVWFENVGSEPTGILEKVYAIRKDFKGSSPVLRGSLGDHENYYAQYERDLAKERKITFTSTEGRATHVVFPYFDLVHGGGGTRIALGWAGTWEATFLTSGNVTTLTAQTNLGLKTQLLPGEKIRTGLVVLLDYPGREEYEGVNLWRRWFMEYNLPKADAQGHSLQPLWTTCFASDTGLPNSDGSISENYFTWQRTLTKLEHEHMLPDFRWFDAGWYTDPSGQTVKTDWWGTIGSWEPDPVKWPDGTLRASNEACHQLGVKVLTWFEPERVTHVEDLARNYGYKVEWGIKTDRCITSNIGDPECLKWTLDRITKMLMENAVDMYREDNNSDPAAAWKILDARDVQKYHLVRDGINENKCIQGHYALWDGIISFCAANGKCTFLDSCASGGGRNDIESLRRSIPLMRSDYDRTTTAMRLSQSSGFNKWVPFHGSSTKDTEGQLEDSSTTPDIYVTRASLLPVWNVNGAYSHNPDLNFDEYRRNLDVWKKNNHLLTKDFYHLSEYHSPTDTSGWTVFAYNDPKTKEGILLAFRQETCEEGEMMVRIPFADAKGSYMLTNEDTRKSVTYSGKQLLEGLMLKLDQPRSSLLLRIQAQ